ncbi:deoxyribodipyrimidine photo-lyase/cryptochrome family protein [Sphingorhabdus pulchriflava]|uniref:Deoxyribodipyrimidine photo-lyase/cryptochrome family protein n=1 Tax=Sphingorhabdus pulchriflava TaxID=2292257 RepID=A0A371BF60_9SPHN|nr:FAD-binding domain-containing protein [Sphingorhabdus pulchriflava]RDV06011.1 deoxyribodipyrimidine photo-lyase/cryptochrome family protein [Sphingorhabdus pulchriflava]
MLQVVWFKRDLRLEDHAALCAAAIRDRILPLVIVEPDYWRQPDVSARQWNFWRACITDLGEAIAAKGGRLCIRVGDAVSVLSAIKAEHGPFVLRAHEETGNEWTFDRDKAVRRWCKTEGIAFEENRQFGVWRGRKVNRDRWAQAWDRMMAMPAQPVPPLLMWERSVTDNLPDAAELGLTEDGVQVVPLAGRAQALATLHSFLHERGEHYTREMSSPLSGETACSRLSWHLAYGSLSIRETLQAAQARYRELPLSEKAWRQSLRSFIARLHWHCHFIQKLESEPEAEYRPMARIYDGLRPRPADAAKLAAWSEGRTGYPFIDAAMRYLNATGWINFRMRAMLMSFASYDLWLHWQESGLVLARKFIDYEPGIHWPQCQMQAGETGINTIRIYSPVKQGYDQDPTGVFIRRWLPELADVPDAWLHEPWKLTEEDRERLCPDYPDRIVDHAAAAKFAKDAIYALRRKPEARAEAKAVVQKHGSRKRTADRKRAGVKADQLKLAL